MKMKIDPRKPFHPASDEVEDPEAAERGSLPDQSSSGLGRDQKRRTIFIGLNRCA